VGRKKPNQPDVQKLVLKEARRIEKNCGTFPPHENAERVIHLVFAGTIIQEATSMISRRENLTSLREKDRSNLTTMIFFFCRIRLRNHETKETILFGGFLLTTLEY